jgi:hypothetical protein
MSISVSTSIALAREVRVTEDELIVHLSDGRTISAPVLWFPRLAGGTPEQRNHWELLGNGEGVHWPELDEDLSVAGLLRGTKPPSTARAGAA